jgi:ribonuclease P protein component
MTAGPTTAGLRRLTKRAQYLNAARGAKAGRAAFSLQAAEALPGPASAADRPGIGLTVTKKTGNSPQRNRIKRRLRAAARACGGDFQARFDYVLVGRREALTLPFSRVVSDLSSAIAKVHAKRATPGTDRR